MSSADPHYLEVRLAHATVRRSGREVLRDVSWIIRPGERGVLGYCGPVRAARPLARQSRSRAR